MPRSPRLAVVALLVSASACAPQDTQTSAPAAPSSTATPASPVATGAPSATTAPASAGATPTATSTACTSDPHAHVYNPDRLRLLAPCVTITGTIAVIRLEADGDDHVLLSLDPGQLCAGQDCLDAGNRTLQHGDLILEPVCEHDVTQADAVAACAGYHNPLVVPPVGTHISVTGPWVHDEDHGWNEIHPVEAFGG